MNTTRQNKYPNYLREIAIKIIKYKCGCLVEWEPGTQRQANCIIHKRPVESYTLWCNVCGVEITASPKAGFRQKRCTECSKKRERVRCRDAWRKGTYKNSDYGIPKIIPRELKESEGNKQRRFIADVFGKLSKKYLPMGITSVPF